MNRKTLGNARKLLVICGPTATGKTNLGLLLAHKFNGEIISADSRQVYKSMNIGTGKDLPIGAKAKVSSDRSLPKYYLIEGIRVWGYDLVDPENQFSVSQYLVIVKNVLEDIYLRGKLPILVGGTGFYIKGVTDGIESSLVPRNMDLRNDLKEKTVTEMYQILAGLDPDRATKLNLSDRKNPRRLIRAIEIAKWKKVSSVKKLETAIPEVFDLLFIGLRVPLPALSERIKKRVLARISVEKEIKKLLRRGVDWNMQSMNTLGYKEWLGYFVGKVELSDIVDNWTKNEQKYAKRQITWFKKDNRIMWFDLQNINWQKNVENLVEKWHNGVHAKES